MFLTMLVSSFIAFFLGQALLSGKHLNASLPDPGALRSIIAAGLYLTVAAMTALALGALLRNTAAAISTFVAVFFVIPPLTMLLPASWSDHFVQYLPSSAGGMLIDGTYGVAHPLAPWTGFALMCAYTVVLIAFGAWRLRRLHQQRGCPAHSGQHRPAAGPDGGQHGAHHHLAARAANPRSRLRGDRR